MTTLQLQSRLARPGGFRLEIDLEVRIEGVLGLFGPSGGGKTTLLRVLAGLERRAGGRLVVGGEVWQDARRFLAPHRRGIGFVFQDARLFQHRSVAGNLRFALDRTPRSARRFTFDEILEVLDLGDLLDRRPAGLSGGETQRVAIGRALLTSPRLLLMDEPLASLDPVRKAEILPYLERLKATVDLPTIYVTHAIDELAQLAETAVLLEGGRVTGILPVAELYDRLALHPFTRRTGVAEPPPNAQSA